MKKLISFILVACTCLSTILCNGAVASAASVSDRSDIESPYWGYTGETVLIDEFSTDTYSMSAYYDGDIVYVITVLANGEIDFSWAPLYGSVRNYQFDTTDFWAPANANKMALLSDDSFVNSAKSHALAHTVDSTVVSKELLTDNSTQVSPASMLPADYNALMNALKQSHGNQHQNYNWTGRLSETISGITYKY